MDKDIALKFLAGSGIAVIISVFTLSGPLLTLTMTLFVIAVVLNCSRIFGGLRGVENIFDFAFDKGSELSKRKIKKGEALDGILKKIKGVTYLIAPSMCFVGVIFTVICLGCMWTMVLCG